MDSRIGFHCTNLPMHFSEENCGFAMKRLGATLSGCQSKQSDASVLGVIGSCFPFTMFMS